MQPIDAVGNRIVLSFNIRGHGGSVQDVPAEPVDYWLRGLEDEDDYFYRGAYMDCVRAMDDLYSRDDVDQDRLAVWGASQGGGLAFATAALDPRVDICLADIPWLCRWRGLMTLLIDQDLEGLAAWLAADPGRSRAGSLEGRGARDPELLRHHEPRGPDQVPDPDGSGPAGPDLCAGDELRHI